MKFELTWKKGRGALIIFGLLFSLLALTACGDKEEPTPPVEENIVGYWALAEDEATIYEFTENGTLIAYYDGHEVATGTYTKEGNGYILEVEGFSTEARFEDGTLFLRGEDGEDYELVASNGETLDVNRDDNMDDNPYNDQDEPVGEGQFAVTEGNWYLDGNEDYDYFVMDGNGRFDYYGAQDDLRVSGTLEIGEDGNTLLCYSDAGDLAFLMNFIDSGSFCLDGDADQTYYYLG